VKVVLDTNVVLSGIFFGGVPGRILTAWSEGRVQLVLTPEILDEYRRAGDALALGHLERSAALTPILTLMASHAVLVDATPLSEAVSADPDDDKFLAAALAASAPAIISGDRDLLEVSGWQGIQVLSPRAFADEYLRQD
jgi:putative PIN family toxin of toxin-antitoxin system